MLDVQLKQSKYMTSVENVKKVCNFVRKCVETEHLQVRLTLMVCPERACAIMFPSSQTLVHSDSGSRDNIALPLISSCRSKLSTQNLPVLTSIASLD